MKSTIEVSLTHEYYIGKYTQKHTNNHDSVKQNAVT